MNIWGANKQRALFFNRMNKLVRLVVVALLSAGMAACMVPSAKKEKTSSPVPDTSAPVQNLSLPDTPSVLIEPPQTQEAPEPEPPAQAEKPVAQKNKHIVRVLLADNQKSAHIQHSGRVYIYTQDVSKKYKISSEGTVSVSVRKTGQVQVGSLIADQPIVLEPDNGTLLTWNNNVYAGKIFIVPANYTFLIVEHADLENYLYGVLPYEMSYSWPLEALKAQAVAARTFTLKTLENKKNKYFDLYSDVRSQMYKGGGKQYDSVRKAVDGTRAQVLTYNGQLFYTYYHGNCGGGTDDVRSWTPTATSIPPLSGASCAYDSHSKTHSWAMDIPAAKVMEYAKKAGISGTLKSVKVASKTHTGRATQLTIQTSKGRKNVSCPKFRLATGLRSCKITHTSMKSQKVHFEGKGYGHGIGMCQDGANGMAKAGKNYQQILKNYYPGAKITPLK